MRSAGGTKQSRRVRAVASTDSGQFTAAFACVVELNVEAKQRGVRESGGRRHAKSLSSSSDLTNLLLFDRQGCAGPAIDHIVDGSKAHRPQRKTVANWRRFFFYSNRQKLVVDERGISRPLKAKAKTLRRRPPKRTYKVPDRAGLQRIVKVLNYNWNDGGLRLQWLHNDLARVVEQLNIREEVRKFDNAVRRLGYANRTPAWLLRAAINLQHRPTVFTDEMLAGNFLPEAVYPMLTGRRPSVYQDGEAVKFVLAVFEELGIKYTAEGVVKAMQRYKVAERSRALRREEDARVSAANKTLRTIHTKK
jgi:hypothetical protein